SSSQTNSAGAAWTSAAGADARGPSTSGDAGGISLRTESGPGDRYPRDARNASIRSVRVAAEIAFEGTAGRVFGSFLPESGTLALWLAPVAMDTAGRNS